MFWKKKKGNLIAKVFKRDGSGGNMTVKTSYGTEFVCGVTHIVERDGFVIFGAPKGGGFVIRVEHFIAAFPND